MVDLDSYRRPGYFDIALGHDETEALKPNRS